MIYFKQIWTASGNGTHNPPTDLLWKSQNSWGTGDLLQTTLISANGEVRPHLEFFKRPLRLLFFLLAITESFGDFIPHQEMAMRKVTRTLFQDDDDDDMVNSSLSRPENIVHHDKRSSELTVTAPNSPCCVSPPAGSSQHKRCREWVQPEEPQGDLRLLRADVGAWLRCLQQRGSTWRPRGTFLLHGNQRTQTGSCKINNGTWQNSIGLRHNITFSDFIIDQNG